MKRIIPAMLAVAMCMGVAVGTAAVAQSSAPPGPGCDDYQPATPNHTDGKGNTYWRGTPGQQFDYATIDGLLPGAEATIRTVNGNSVHGTSLSAAGETWTVEQDPGEVVEHTVTVPENGTLRVMLILGNGNGKVAKSSLEGDIVVCAPLVPTPTPTPTPAPTATPTPTPTLTPTPNPRVQLTELCPATVGGDVLDDDVVGDHQPGENVISLRQEAGVATDYEVTIADTATTDVACDEAVPVSSGRTPTPPPSHPSVTGPIRISAGYPSDGNVAWPWAGVAGGILLLGSAGLWLRRTRRSEHR